MKPDIHPDYVDCTVRCSCGNTFQTKATKPEIRVDICNVCHPFYTGTQKLIDTGGRVQRFADRFGNATDLVAEREAAKKAERAAKVAEKEAAKKAEREAKAKEKEERAAKYAAEAERAAKAEEKAAAEAEAQTEADQEASNEEIVEADVATDQADLAGEAGEELATEEKAEEEQPAAE